MGAVIPVGSPPGAGLATRMDTNTLWFVVGCVGRPSVTIVGIFLVLYMFSSNTAQFRQQSHLYQDQSATSTSSVAQAAVQTRT